MNASDLPPIEIEYKNRFTFNQNIANQLIAERIPDQILTSQELISSEASQVLDGYFISQALGQYAIATEGATEDGGHPSLPERPLVVTWDLAKAEYNLQTNILHVQRRNFADLLSDLDGLLPQSSFAAEHARFKKVYQIIGYISSACRHLFGRQKPAWMVGAIYHYLAPLTPVQRFFDSVKLYWKTIGAIEPADLSQIPKPNLKLRTQLKAAFQKSLEHTPLAAQADTISSYLALSYPVILLEDRKRQFKHFLGQYNQKICAGFLTFNYWHSIKDTYCAAITKHLKKDFIVVQHGGYYGYCFNHCFAFLEYANADYFLTWGWQDYSFGYNPGVKAKPIAVGSFYLRNLRRRFSINLNTDAPETNYIKPSDSAPSLPRKKIVYMPTTYVETTPYRFHLPYLEFARIKKDLMESLPYLFDFVKAHGLELCVKFTTNNISYAKIFHEEAAKAGVPITALDPSIPAYRVFDQCDALVWDAVGSGFLESNAIGKPTFLFASARFLPGIEGRDIYLAPEFYLDKASPLDIFERYRQARRASQDFFIRFGRSSQQKLEEFLDSFSGC